MTAPQEEAPFIGLKQGDRARVTAICGQTCFCQRIQEMGLVPGTEFCVERVAPFGDPIEIAFRGQRICIRRCEADGIEIERVE